MPDDSPATLASIEAIVSKRVGPIRWDNGRKEDNVKARRWFCWLAHRAGFGWSQIGRHAGCNHGNVIHHYHSAQDHIATDKQAKQLSLALMRDLRDSSGETV